MEMNFVSEKESNEMKRARIIFIVLVLAFAPLSKSQAQVSLYPEVSAETNGMGAAGVSFVSDNALATIANPAELGVFSLNGTLSASYMPNIPNQLNSFAINSGLTLNTFLHDLPFKTGIGIGYSNINYSYPQAHGPENLINTDIVKGVTIGGGIDYFVRLGLGYTLKWVSTKYYPQEYSSTYAPDFGAIVQIPAIDILSKINGSPVFVADKVAPLVNVALGYSARNVGNYAPRGIAWLPREAALGWNIEAGFKSNIMDRSWEWISFTLLRQANASLVNSSVYSRGLGNFQVYDNIIAGKPTGVIAAQKGWQLQLGEFIYFREGSVTDPGYLSYTTFGWGVRLNGLATTLIFLHGLETNGILSFFLNHLDVRYEYSKAVGETVNPLYTRALGFRGFGGKSVETLSLMIR